MSRKSFTLGTGVIALRPLTDMVERVLYFFSFGEVLESGRRREREIKIPGRYVRRRVYRDSVCENDVFPHSSPPPGVALLVRGERDKLTSGKGKSGNHVISKTEN